MEAELFVGLMSGTSVDGVDAALVRLDPSPSVLYARTFPISDALRRRIRAASVNMPLHEFASLDVEMGELFARCVLDLLDGAAMAPAQVRAIGSHGQTLWHQPQGTPPFTLQIGDANIIAERTGIATVADFRRRDLAAGGQGAPLVPAFHAEAFGSDDENRCVLNLGGIANITILPRASRAGLIGFDTGPANTLLDAWISRHRQQACDIDGEWAASGHCSEKLLIRLMADAYFERLPPKSTGPEYFSLGWLDRHLTAMGPLAAEDVQATLVALTARSVADAIEKVAPRTERVLVCGGGARNPVLVQALAERLSAAKLESTAAEGVDPDYVEACAFAWLARQTLSGRTGNLMTVTGARRPVILGGIYPGRA